MSDSIWKKEITFRRKPDEEPAADGDVLRELQLAFERKLADAAAAGTAEPAPEPAAEVVAEDELHVVEAPVEGEPSIWRKEISFRRKPRAPRPAETEEPQLPPTISPAGGESIWKKEISFRRKPQAAVADTPPSESIWKKEITFRRKSDGPRGDSIWTRDISLRRRAARQAQIQRLAEEALRQIDGDAAVEFVPPPKPEPRPEPEPERTPQPVEIRVELPPPLPAAPVVAPEPWLAEPELPPEPAVEAEPEPEPEPVPAAETEAVPPAAPAAAEEAHPVAPVKTPVWKREISIPKRRGRKPDVPAQAESKPERAAKPRRSLSLPKPAPRTGTGGSHAVKRIVGLKVGASQLAAARVSNNGAAELVQVVREPLESGVVVAGEVRDPEALADALKRFFAKNKLPKKNVRLGVASNRIGVRIFELAGIDDERQLENAVRFRAQEALPIPLDEAVLDYRVLDESVGEDGEKTQRILLVVAYRELVDRYVSACRKAGLSLAGVDLEAFALLRALRAPTNDDASSDAALVAVSIGHDRSTFAVSDGRICEFTRVIEWGGATLNVAIARALDLAPSEVESVKRLVALDSQAPPAGMEEDKYLHAVDAVHKQVQAFARELVSSLQFYQHQPGSLGIGEIVITGGTAGLSGIAEELERLIGVRVRVGDPLARMKVPKKLAVDEQVGSLAIAIGLGIED
jgi:type IV pilus assembly protein PilM